MTTKDTDLVKTGQPFNPENLGQAMELAKVLAMSGLVPGAMRGKPADILVVMLTGRELGIPPMQALNELHVIDGKPGSSAALKVALCKRHPGICLYFRMVESKDDMAIYETRRAGSPEPERITYTIADATKAGLTNKTNWKTSTKAMLRARASSALATAVYQDLVKGLMTFDELEEATGKPISQQYGADVVVQGEFVRPGVPMDPTPVNPDAELVDPIQPIDTEDAFWTSPEDEGTADPGPREQIEIAISEAVSIKDLEALVTRIKALSKEDQAGVRDAYGAKRRSLNAGKAK